HRTTGTARFFAYADPAAGEYGAVYQAAGWAYLGQGLNGDANGRVRRAAVLRPGANASDPAAWQTDRALRRGKRLSVAQARAEGWQISLRPGKHVYTTYVGRERGAWCRTIAALPYPAPEPDRKRKARVTSSRE